MNGQLRPAMPMILLLTITLGACSLAEDVTPPSGMETSGPVITSGPVATEVVGPAQPPDLRAGAAIYAEKCSPCHGPSGMGEGAQAAGLPNPATALGDPAIGRQAVPAAWYETVTVGNIEGFMPGFRSLSDAERWDVVAYALNLSTASDRQAAAGITYVEECAGCHGVSGEGGAHGPALNDPGWLAARSLQQVYAAITAGVGSQMPSYSERLTDDERWDLAVYVRNLALVGSMPQTEAATTPAVEATVIEAEPSGSPEAESTPAAEAGPTLQSTLEGTAEAARGTVRGSVVQGTSGEAVPSGLEVTLHGFDGQAEVVNATSTVGRDGSFLFEGVESVPGRLFVVTTEVDGVLYGTETALLADTSGVLDQTLLIFGTTTDPSQLRISRMHLLLNPAAEGVLEVIQLWLVSNDGDRTVVAGDGDGVLNVVLPESAFGLAFEDGTPEARFTLTEQGFQDTEPVRPGTMSAQLVFSYVLPYDGRLDFSQPVDHPVDAVIALVPEGDMRLSGAGVQDQGTRDMAGSQVHAYGYEPVAAGQALAFRISGRSNVSGGSGNTLSSVAIGVGVLGVALISAGLWWYRRPGPRAVLADGQVGQRQGLLRQLVELDEAHEAGEIDDDAYQRRRAAGKQRLVELMRGPDD